MSLNVQMFQSPVTTPQDSIWRLTESFLFAFGGTIFVN